MATVAEDRAAAQQAANSTLAQAQTYLDQLTQAANVVFSNPGFNIDSVLPATYNYASVPTVDFPVIGGGLRPDSAGLDLPGTPEAPIFAAFSVLTDVALPVDDLLAPTHNFEYLEAAYISTLLDPLQAKLLNDLLNGGYGIDTTDEQALFQRARDREMELALTRIDEAGRTMAARGFPLPPGELSIQIDRVYQELQSKLSSVSREIFVDSAKRFVENRRFTIEQVRSLEQLTMGFHNSVQERALNVAKATAEYAVLVYNQLLARYRTRLDAAKIATDVQLGRAQVEVARMQGVLGVFQGQIAAYEARLRSLIDPFKARVDLYRADIDGNRNITDGLVARASLQQKVIEATVQQNIQISNLAIENAKAKLLATVQALQFQTSAAQFGSQQFFATLTAMFGAINSLGVQTATDA